MRGGGTAPTRNAASDMVSAMWSIARAVLMEQADTMAGSIVPGTYDPTQGTVSVLVGTEASQDLMPFRDAGQVYPGLPLAVSGMGHQEGPWGGEPCTVHKRPGGWTVTLEQWSSSPGAPSGESWLVKRAKPTLDPNQGFIGGAIQAFLKFTNDAKTVGDALAGAYMLCGAFAKFYTAGGISLVFDDSVPSATLTVGTGSSAVVMLLNAATPQFKVTVGSGLVFDENGSTDYIELGADGLPTTDRVARVSDVQAAFNTFAAGVQPGSGATPPTVGGSSKAEAE